MNAKKILLLTSAILAALLCLGFFEIKAFTQKVYNSRSCDWANIDNIEIRTLTDIPDIKDSDCFYDDKTDTKQVVFTLDTKVNLPDYITKNHFIKLDPEKKPEIIPSFSFDKDASAFTKAATLYYKKDDQRDQGESYTMLLDPETHKLWIYLKYHN